MITEHSRISGDVIMRFADLIRRMSTLADNLLIYCLHPFIEVNFVFLMKSRCLYQGASILI